MTLSEYNTCSSSTVCGESRPQGISKQHKKPKNNNEDLVRNAMQYIGNKILIEQENPNSSRASSSKLNQETKENEGIIQGDQDLSPSFSPVLSSTISALNKLVLMDELTDSTSMKIVPYNVFTDFRIPPEEPASSSADVPLPKHYPLSRLFGLSFGCVKD